MEIIDKQMLHNSKLFMNDSDNNSDTATITDRTPKDNSYVLSIEEGSIFRSVRKAVSTNNVMEVLLSLV